MEEEQLTNYENQLKENIMKLLRVGIKGKEKPAALDKNGKIRDISSHITDLKSDTVNFETIKKLESVRFRKFT